MNATHNKQKKIHTWTHHSVTVGDKRVAIRCSDKGSEIISPKISAERQNTLSRILYSDKFSLRSADTVAGIWCISPDMCPTLECLDSIRRSTSWLWEALGMTRLTGFLPPTLEHWTVFVLPVLALAQPGPLWVFKEGVSKQEHSPYLYLSGYHGKINEF